MAHGQDKADELALVRCQGPVTRGDWPAEERQGVLSLYEDGAEPVCRGIALHDKWQTEVEQGEHRRRGDGGFERRERTSADQENPSLRSRAVRGAAIVPNSLTNLW
jgi:hypothetical protein